MKCAFCLQELEASFRKIPKTKRKAYGLSIVGEENAHVLCLAKAEQKRREDDPGYKGYFEGHTFGTDPVKYERGQD